MTFHFLLEFVTFIIPAICVCTFFNDRKYLYLGLFVTWISLIVVNRLQAIDLNRLVVDVLISISSRRRMVIFWMKKRLTVGERDSLLLSEEWLSYIRTNYGSGIYCDRCVSILAVDFTIFPRKYAKTYLSGYSLVSYSRLLILCLDGHWCWNVHLHEWSGEWN